MKDIKEYIIDVPNFPKPGILFRDITPLMGNGEAFTFVCEEMAQFAKNRSAEVVLGPEARGFIFGCPVAKILGVGFVPVRKPNKLPRQTITESYDLEYGSNSLSIHADAIKKGQKVIIVDDLLATGGTIEATIKLVEKAGGIVAGLIFLIELTALNGREKLTNYPLFTLLQY